MTHRGFKFATMGVAALALAAVALLAGSAAAKDTMPFKGSAAGTFVPRDVPTDPKAEGTAKVSGLGLTKVTVRVDGTSIVPISFNFPILVARFDAETVWVAANGDQLFDTAVYIVTQNLITGDATSVGVCTFTGGTGRFAGATGGYEVTSVTTGIPGDDNDPWTSAFNGSLSTVGSNK